MFTEIFNMEEKTILNHVAVDLEKDECCDQLRFSMEVTEDEECAAVLQSLYSKVYTFSGEEWDGLQSYLPFNVDVSEEDVSFDNEWLLYDLE